MAALHAPSACYKAFISYSRKDETAAVWLHRALERYRVPGPLVGRNGPAGTVGKRLFPVFRDKEELGSAADLSQAILDALDRSDFLIVICSPAAARSRWVNEEILAFKRKGRAERIIALIVAGEPNAELAGLPEDQECFPRALRHALGADGALSDERVEPLAADVRPQGDGRPLALLKIVAGLLGVSLDTIRQRDAAARRRRLLVRAAGAASALVGGALGLVQVSYFGFQRPTEEYHESWVLDATGPHLVSSLRRAVAQSRAHAIVAERDGWFGQLRYVAAADAGGVERGCAAEGLSLAAPFAMPPYMTDPTPYAFGVIAPARPCSVEFGYDRAILPGAAIGFTVYDQFGRTLAIVDLGPVRARVRTQGPDVVGLPRPGVEAIVELERDGADRIVSARYFDRQGAPLPVFGSASRVDYAYDVKTGLVASYSFLDYRGQPAPSHLYGRAGLRLAYDDRGRVTEVTSVDPDGALRWDPERYDPPRRTFAYDAAGNRVAASFRDADGQLAEDLSGIAEVRYEIANGRLTGVRYLDAQGRAMEAGRIPCPIDRIGYDGRGRPEWTYCFSGDGRPIRDPEVHGRRVVLDRKADWIERAFVDVDGRPMPDARYQAARVTRRYDENGQLVEEASFDAEGKPAISRLLGAARAEFSYDSRGGPTGERYYGPDGGLMIVPRLGYAAIKIGYDESGPENLRCFFGPDDRPMVHPQQGYACMRTARNQDSNGRTIVTWTEGADGRPTSPPSLGYHRVERLLTRDGLHLRIRFLDTDGRPAVPAGGAFAEQRNALDPDRRLLRVDFYGADGQRTSNGTCGYASVAIDYRPDRQIGAIAFFDPAGRSVAPPKLGTASIRRLPTQTPGLDQYETLDIQGRPVQSPAARPLLRAISSGELMRGLEDFLLSGGACPI